MTDATDRHRRASGADMSEHEVEKLIRMASNGPKIPVDGAERLKETLRPVWQHEVRVRRWRRRSLVIGTLAAAACAVVAVTTMIDMGVSSPAPAPAATTVIVRGECEVADQVGATRWIGAGSGSTAIAVGSRLDTGDSGRVAVGFTEGGSLRLDVRTSVRFLSPKRIELERGGVYFDSEDRELGIEVVTDGASVRDIGTQFEVRREAPALIVRVREGLVSVTRDRELVEVGAGNQLTAYRGRGSELRPLSPTAEVWSWVHLVSPPFPIDGRTAAEFLDWVERETGLGVEYDDDATRLVARAAVLSGRIDDLTPGQAVQLVLPSCGLAAEVSGGELLIRRIE